MTYFHSTRVGNIASACRCFWMNIRKPSTLQANPRTIQIASARSGSSPRVMFGWIARVLQRSP